MAFDRLIYIDRLKGAGVEESVARAHAEALRDALGETVATKADLADAVRELKDSIATLERKSDIQFSALDRKFDIQFSTLDRKFDIQFGTLDHKIDVTARNLTIAAGSGLLIVVSLIVSLKYFG